MNLHLEDAQIETIKTEGNALFALNETLEDLNIKRRVKVFTVFLNKDVASFLLKFNLKNPAVTNRPVNWSIVESMARQILNGHFRNTGEPLLFTDSGDGIDLQHRCYAVLKAAETDLKAGYETTIITGIYVENLDSLIDNLLVMGVAKRTKLNLAHFANVDARKWETVEYYMLPEDIKPGSITKSLSKLEINDEYKSKRNYYDTVFETVSSMFKQRKDVNAELGEKRIPVYSAAVLKMMDIDKQKAMDFIGAFFNPLENSLPKGNPVDAVRQELLDIFAMGQRDKTRPIFIRRALLAAFSEFHQGHIRTKWHHFINNAANLKNLATATELAATPSPSKVPIPRGKAQATVAAADIHGGRTSRMIQ